VPLSAGVVPVVAGFLFPFLAIVLPPYQMIWWLVSCVRERLFAVARYLKQHITITL